MIKNIILGNEDVNLALAEFSDDTSEENFLRLIACLAESYDMDDQYFVAFDGDTFQSIHEEDGDYLVMFTSLESAELGPDTDLMVMDLDNLIGNVLLDEQMSGFVIDPFSECVFIDRDAANVVRSVALSGPVIEVMKDMTDMDLNERLWLAQEIEKGEDNYVPNKVLAAVLYNEIADAAMDPEYEPDPDDMQEIDSAKSEAMTHLGRLILEGAFFERDEERAKELFSMAAAKLNTEAMVELGRLEEKNDNPEGAAALYQKAAMMGETQGLVEFGRMMLYGLGVEKNPGMAEECFLKASDMGLGDAFYYLGLMAEKGMLREPDEEKAEFYYSQGADFDDRRCMDKMIELFGGLEDDDEDDDDYEDPEDDPYIFDFSKGPRDLRS